MSRRDIPLDGFGQREWAAYRPATWPGARNSASSSRSDGGGRARQPIIVLDGKRFRVTGVSMHDQQIELRGTLIWEPEGLKEPPHG